MNVLEQSGCPLLKHTDLYLFSMLPVFLVCAFTVKRSVISECFCKCFKPVEVNLIPRTDYESGLLTCSLCVIGLNHRCYICFQMKTPLIFCAPEKI